MAELPLKLQRAVQEIADDRNRGASELARRALQIVATAARQQPAAQADLLRAQLYDLVTALSAARPSMAPIQNLLTRWRVQVDALDALTVDQLRAEAATGAEQLAHASQEAVVTIADRGARLVKTGQTIITHSFSSTVLALLKQLQDQQIRVIVSEARPRCEGYALAEQLAAWAIPTTVITDAQMGLFVREADIALIGADSLLPDGAVVNKVGTYLLALAAAAAHVPVYVCCESFKRRTSAMPPLTLEAMDPAELGAPTHEQITVKNIYFDVTPAHRITGWIHEQEGPMVQPVLQTEETQPQ